MMFPNHVTNHNSFEDSVKILKNRGLLNEGDAVKGTPDKEPSYESPTPNADVKYKKVEQSPEVDEQDGIYPATTVKDIPKLKTSKKVKDKSDGLEPIKPHDTKNEMKKVKIVKATEQTLKESKKRLTERDNSEAQMAWEESVSDELADMFKAGKISQKEHDAAQNYLETHGYDLYDPYEGNNDVEYILSQSKIVNLKEAIKRMVNEELAKFKSQSKKKLTESKDRLVLDDSTSFEIEDHDEDSNEARFISITQDDGSEKNTLIIYPSELNKFIDFVQTFANKQKLTESKKKLTEAIGEQSVDLYDFEIVIGNDTYMISGIANVIGKYEEPNYVDGYIESSGGWAVEGIELELDNAYKIDPNVEYDEEAEITSPEDLDILEMAIYKDRNAFNALYNYINGSIDYDNFD